MKRFLSLFLCAALLCSGCSLTESKADVRAEIYQNALTLLEEGKQEQAFALFISLGDYEDAEAHLARFVYLPTEIRTENYGFGDTVANEIVTLTYNADGKLTEEKNSYVQNDGPTYLVRHSYTNGLCTRTETNSEAGDSISTYEYDQQNRLIRRVGVTHGANVGGITQYTYDENDRCIRTEFCSYLGVDPAAYINPYSKDVYTYTYDEKGNPISTTSNGVEHHTAQYTDGLLTSISSQFDDTKQVTTFTYDQNGRCIKVNTPHTTAEFTYDERGALQSSIHLQSDGTLARRLEYTCKLFYCPDGAPVPPHLKEFVSGLLGDKNYPT